MIVITLIIHSFFNFGLLKNYKLFLGDSGSNLIGFIISFIPLFEHHKSEQEAMPISVPLNGIIKCGLSLPNPVAILWSVAIIKDWFLLGA